MSSGYVWRLNENYSTPMSLAHFSLSSQSKRYRRLDSFKSFLLFRHYSHVQFVVFPLSFFLARFLLLQVPSSLVRRLFSIHYQVGGLLLRNISNDYFCITLIIWKYLSMWGASASLRRNDKKRQR